MARRVIVFLRVLAALLPIMPLPGTTGTGRLRMAPVRILASPPPPSSGVQNMSGEDVFNMSGEGLFTI